MGLIPFLIGWNLAKKHTKKMLEKPEADLEELKEALRTDSFAAWVKKRNKR